MSIKTTVYINMNNPLHPKIAININKLSYEFNEYISAVVECSRIDAIISTLLKDFVVVRILQFLCHILFYISLKGFAKKEPHLPAGNSLF